MNETTPTSPNPKENKSDFINKSELTENLEFNICKILPCETTEDILNSVFDKDEKFLEPIDSILKKEFTIEGFLKSQEESDALTDKLYKKNIENGKIIFPLKRPNICQEPFIGNIGEQTSMYHKESILEHIAMVVKGISEDNNYDINMQLVGLLHDAGKKYALGTNQRGEVCFYGHEKVSAYIAATIYRQLGFSKEEAEPYIRIIHGHMLPFNSWRGDQEKISEYRKLYGDLVTNGIISLNKNDLGITEYDLQDMKALEKKKVLIEEGEKIIQTLDINNLHK